MLSCNEIKNLLSQGLIEKALEAIRKKVNGTNFEDEIILFKAELQNLKEKEEQNIISNEGYTVDRNGIIKRILSTINELNTHGYCSEHQEGIKKTILKDSDEIKEIAEKYAENYNNGKDFKEREKTLQKIISIYIDNKNRVNAAKNFIRAFDKKVDKNKKIFKYAGTKLNRYPLIINCLKNGIPQVPHFFGMLNFTARDMLEQPALPLSLNILKLIEKKGKGYKAAYKEITSKSYIDSIIETDFYFYYYLLGQVYRKNNFLQDAISIFERGIILVNSKKEMKETDLLLLCELHRGMATAYRKLKNGASTEGEKIKYHKNSTKNYREARKIFADKLKNTSLSAKKVGSDIYFSHGYFEFENFFNHEDIFKKIEIGKAKKIRSIFDESYALNPQYTAPLARKAIIEMYMGEFEKSYRGFSNVYRIDNLYLRQKSDNERVMAQIWVGIAILELEKLAPSCKGIQKVDIAYLLNLIKSYKIPKIHSSPIANISGGILECHTYDLGVVIQALRLHSKLEENYTFYENNQLITAYWQTVKELLDHPDQFEKSFHPQSLQALS